MSKNIQIELDDAEYAYLKRIAIDISPDEYAKKYLQMHLLGSFDVVDNKKNIHKKQFHNLKYLIVTYGIKQGDIATYFSVSQASVSTFLKKENEKSHLYPKFFTHSTSKSLLYNIYINKYTLGFKESYSTEEQGKINQSLNDSNHKEKALSIASIVAVLAKERSIEDFNIDIFIKNLQDNKYILQNVDYNKIDKKNLEYLHAVVQELLNAV